MKSYLIIILNLLICWECKASLSANGDINSQSNNEVFLFTIQRLFKRHEVLFLLYNEESAHELIPKPLSNPHLYYNVNENITIPNVEIKFYYNFLLFSTQNRLLEIVTRFRNSNLWNNLLSLRGRYLLIALEPCNKTDIFSALWKQNIINAWILEKQDAEKQNWLLYGYEPFSLESKCGKVINPKIYNFTAFESGFQKFYPNQLLDCKYNTSVLNIILPRQYLSTGFILKPLLLFCDVYKINLTMFNPSSEIQEMLLTAPNNIIWNGLIEKDYDMLLGDFELCDDLRIEHTRSIFLDERIWYVPAPKRISQALVLLYVFKLQTWLYILATVIFSMLLWYKICRLKLVKNHNVLGLLGLCCGFGMATSKLRVLNLMFMFYLFFAQHINSFFQANLSSKLTIPIYEKRIETIEDLIESKLVIYTFPTERTVYRNLSNPLGKRLYERSLDQVGFPQNKVTLVKDNGSIAIENFKSISGLTPALMEYVHTIPHTLMAGVYVKYALSAGNPTILILNKFIARLKENGFIVKWIKDMKLHVSNFINGTVSSVDSDAKLLKIELHHIQGAFILYWCGVFVGLLILLCEIYAFRK